MPTIAQIQERINPYDIKWIARDMIWTYIRMNIEGNLDFEQMVQYIQDKKIDIWSVAVERALDLGVRALVSEYRQIDANTTDDD